MLSVSLCAKVFFVLISLLLVVNLNISFAGDAFLSWSAPTKNADGSPLTDLAGYQLYYGTSSKAYTKVVNVGKTTHYTVTGLPDGVYYFAATAYDTSGNESVFSNEIFRTIPEIQNYTLSVTKSGTGSGTIRSSPAGISCGADCSELYAQGKVVTLTAVASAGSTFSGWTGGGCSGMGQCVTTVNSNATVTASFTPQPESQPISQPVTVSQPVSLPSGAYSFAWNMDHPSGHLVAYTSSGTRTGTMSGGTIGPSYGQAGDGIRFTAADQYVTWSVTGSEVSGDEATVWLSVYRNGATDGHQLIEIYRGSGQIISIAIAYANGNIRLRHLGNGSVLRVHSSNVIPNGTWTRLGCSWSASRDKLAVKIGENVWEVFSGTINPPISSPTTFTVGEKSENRPSASTVYIDNVFVLPGFINADPY